MIDPGTAITIASLAGAGLVAYGRLAQRVENSKDRFDAIDKRFDKLDERVEDLIDFLLRQHGKDPSQIGR